MTSEAYRSRKARDRRGLLIVHTGDGKGKTTAALGTVLRAWGRGMAVCVFQFVKARTGNWGEVRAARRLGIPWHTLGEGFSWQGPPEEVHAAAARAGWELATRELLEGGHDLVVLDEFTYPLHYGWIPLAPVLATLARRPAHLHVIVTGRHAPPELLAAADLVTEMRKHKHPYDVGIAAQPGIEF